jgi:DNA polymerase-3 subunit delta'
MANALEHPDIHWYFPLPRPKRATGDRLVEALEDARREALAERRAAPLMPSHSDEVRGLYLGAVRNIRARAHKRPTMAAGPIFVVGDAELLVPQEASPEAANALLKLLEEPPGAGRFLLTSSEPGLLLPTIVSRTVPMHVSALPAADVAAFLVEHAGIETEVAQQAAALSHGSVGRALGFLPGDDGEPGPLEALRRRALDIVLASTSDRVSAGYVVAAGFPPVGARKLIDLFFFVEEWLRDLAAVAAGAEKLLLNGDALDRLRRHVADAGIEAVDVPVAFSKVETARELARGNVNPQLVVSGLVRDLRGAFAASRAPAAAVER